ncbi:MAG: ureidoglycolate lyase, partial [Cyclobacteriaceae bacterium]|nr:ureidoglycolate lyase [Cyclobacteriaceae bacterium]
MKLLRFGETGREKPGVKIKDKWLDCSGFGEDWTEEFLENDGIQRLEKWLEDEADNLAKIDPNTRLGSPIKRPSKIICVGLNYSLHAKESGMPVPDSPIL